MRLAEGALRAGYRLNHFETLGSTNDEALRRAVAGDRGRLWVVADAQASGRGRQGREWASPPGNLYATLLLVDVVAQARAWEAGFVAGIALADAVRSVAGDQIPVAIKWPNDLLAGEAKLAGVLAEGTVLTGGAFALVVGFGVNCGSHPQGTPYPATDLASLCPDPPTPAALFSALSDRMPAVVSLWQDSGFAAIRALWLERALSPGTPITVSAKGERRAGLFRTIDPDGRLVFDTAEGPVCLAVGDVFTAKAPASAG